MMAFKAKFQGREAVMRRLNRMVPDAEKELAEAQLDVAKEAASRIAARAKGIGSGDYVASIQADRIGNRSPQELIGLGQTKDKNATGVFADYVWRWLEFGTTERVTKSTGAKRGQVSPQPHIFPTWRAFKKTARRRMAAAVNKAVKRAKG